MKELLKHLRVYKKEKEPIVEEPICDNNKKQFTKVQLENIQELKDSLKEGELICPKCDGLGFTNKIQKDKIGLFKYTCPKCKGRGKLDWIENVVGKKVTYFDGSSEVNINIM
jgi:DnaJ-class molecular chaperone